MNPACSSVAGKMLSSMFKFVVHGMIKEERALVKTNDFDSLTFRAPCGVDNLR